MTSKMNSDVSGNENINDGVELIIGKANHLIYNNSRKIVANNIIISIGKLNQNQILPVI